MHGAAISPWTMSYFATSLLSLAAALLLMTSGFGFPSAPVEAADTLVVVHLVTIGWLGLLFCGALLQFVPVLVAAPARLPVVAGPALALIVCGLASLLAGFLGLGGRIGVDPFALPVGAVLLILGFGGLIASFAATILSEPFDLTVSIPMLKNVLCLLFDWLALDTEPLCKSAILSSMP